MDHREVGGARRPEQAKRGSRAGNASDDLVTTNIESLNYDARGVARVNGKATFVDGALPGETVRFRLVSRRRRHDSGVLAEVIHPSPDRIDPACPHFGQCGGCSLQHLRPEAQIAAKQRILADALRHIGRVQPQSWLAPLTGPVWHYRRRARFGVRWVENKGGSLVGFRERRRSFVTPLKTCPVLDKRVSILLPHLKELIDGLSCPHRIPQVEVAAGDESVALVIRHLLPLTGNDRDTLSRFAEAHGVQMLLQGGGVDSIEPLLPPSASPAPLHYRIPDSDVAFAFGATDFVQVNDEMNRRMVASALELLAPSSEDRVLDLFCGLGNFTLPLARMSGRVLGIEADEALVDRARDNALRNGLANVEFRCADLFVEQGDAPWRDFPANKLLLDPPRDGAMAVIKRLAEPLPARIVYVSCYPSTLARDAAYLTTALGYEFRVAGVMDMFPHTSHVESIALFSRPDNAV